MARKRNGQEDTEKFKGHKVIRQGTVTESAFTGNRPEKLEDDDLDNYLSDRENYEIYQVLMGQGAIGTGETFLFHPLEFLRLYHNQLEFIENNKARPLFVAQSLKALNLSDNQFKFFYECILRKFKDSRDESIMICRDEILTHYNILEWDNRDYWSSESANESDEPPDRMAKIFGKSSHWPTREKPISRTFACVVRRESGMPKVL